MKARLALLYVVILGLAAWFAARHWSSFESLSFAEPWLLVPASLACVGFFLTNGIHSRVFFEAYGLKLRPKEWFGLSVINTLGNLTTFLRGGSVTNALYLKRVHGLAYSSFLGMLSATYVIVFFVNSSLGLAALWMIPKIPGPSYTLVLATFLAVFLGFGFVLFFSPRLKWSGLPSILQRGVDMVNAWHQLRSNRRIVGITLLIAAVNVALMAVMSYLELRMVGTHVGWREAVMISVFGSFSIFLAVTPGSLGIREAFAVLSAAVVGVNPAAVVAASLVDRLLNFVWSLALGAYFSRALMDEVSASAKVRT